MTKGEALYQAAILASGRTSSAVRSPEVRAANGLFSIAEAAERFGVTFQEVSLMRYLINKSTPTVIQAVREGKLSAYNAKLFVEKVTRDQQDTLLEKAIQNVRGRVLLMDKTLGKEQPPKYRKPKLHDQMTTGLESLKNYLAMIQDRLSQPDAKDHESLQAWLDELYRIRLSITHILKQHRTTAKEEEVNSYAR